MKNILDEDDLDAQDSEADAAPPEIAMMKTEEAVRYLMSFGTAEMDARFLVALAKGEITGDARPISVPEGTQARAG